MTLDQKKAYNKIVHDYLWRVLWNMKTSVMINSMMSRPYHVYQGVQQGNPLSCLLFDLAIELWRDSERCCRGKDEGGGLKGGVAKGSGWGYRLDNWYPKGLEGDDEIIMKEGWDNIDL
ncbi:hypothetical protein L227DRAFT_566658 [Lentinus tigrinus ALCF2SS1-6]|uniref:Reverse transcriptase domain-containing protein n=1 Tax=Lentinus tigrinus ALCF2SS1-6 TaxID=1328759 RepID=A0A5C2RX42_9APHY|nr:hypothetical protein L227DRAFT_566658 [Lentinus tigrinus ALCF2SS1-6]